MFYLNNATDAVRDEQPVNLWIRLMITYVSVKAQI